MSHRRRAFALACLALILLPRDSRAQPRRDTLPPMPPLPTVDTLVARLSGETVTLDALQRVAAREALAGRMAAAEARRAEGAVVGAGRAMDPTLAFRSGVASDLFGAGQGRAVNNVVEGVAGTRWGTDVGVSYARQDGSGFDPVRQLAAPSTFAVSVVQPLLEGRTERAATMRAAARERSAAEFVQQRTLREVAASVELQYWSLAEAQSVEAVRLRSLELAERILERTTRLVTLQLAPEVDLLALQSGVALRRAALLEAEQRRRDRSDALVFSAYGARATTRLADGALLRTDPRDDRVDSSALAATGTPEGLRQEWQRALTYRADVQAARERRDAADVRLAIAQNSTRPSLSVEGGWAAVSNAVPRGDVASRNGTLRGWRAGVSLSAPVLNREDRGRAIGASAELDLEDLRLQQLENSVREELRATGRAVEGAHARWQVLQEAAQLAARQLDAERQRQELGLGDVFRLLQTEDYAVQAQLESVRARYDLLRAQVRWRLVTGTAPLSR